MKFEAGDFEFSCCGPITHVESANRVRIAKAEAFHRTMRDVEQGRQIGVIAIRQQQAISRNQPDEMFEGSLDRIEIFENVRVIKFEIIDNGDLRQIVNK